MRAYFQLNAKEKNKCENYQHTSILGVKSHGVSKLTWSFCYDSEDPAVIDKLLTATLTTPTTLSCLFSGLKQWLSSFLLLSSIWTPTKYATWTNRGFSKTKTPEAPRYVKVEFSNSQYNLVEFVLWHYFYQKFTIKKGQNKLVSIYILHKDFQFSLYTTKIEV